VFRFKFYNRFCPKPLVGVKRERETEREREREREGGGGGGGFIQS